MLPFNVLSKDQPIHGSLVLEASAGTGKTFSIENLVARYLIECPDLSITELAIVTFTKAAASDLRLRIRSHCRNLLQKLKNNTNLPPYLADMPLEQKAQAIRALRKGLAEFDQAEIATIHAFCFKAIREHDAKTVAWQSKKEDEISSLEASFEILADLFQTQVLSKNFSQGQIQRLLKSHMYSVAKLAKSTIAHISKGMEIVPPLTNDQMLANAQKAMEQIQQKGDKIYAEILKHAPAFYKACIGKTKEIKKDLEQALSFLSIWIDKNHCTYEDLDKSIDVLEDFFKIFSLDNLKVKGEISDTLRSLLIFFKNTLQPAIEAWSEPSFLQARLMHLCQVKLWDEYEAKSITDFAYLLQKMDKLSSQEDFVDAIRKRYKRIIIDEFQDTDPVQWSIFKKLFLQANLPMVLVGDPKQSIYSFRSADVYTYLQAACAWGEASRFGLTTNYRSTPRLVSALNTFFDSSSSPGWMPLPARNDELVYPHVQASLNRIDERFADESALELLIPKVSEKTKLDALEEQYFFPYFVKEAERLKREKGISYAQMAILVRDQYQAERVSAYFRMHGISVLKQRAKFVADALLLTDLIYLLKAITNPKNNGFLHAALGGKILNGKWDLLLASDDSFERISLLALIYAWKETLKSYGIARCLDEVLASKLPNEQLSIEESILLTEDGKQHYFELQQIIAYLSAKEHALDLSSHKLIEELEALALNEDDEQKMDLFEEDESIAVLTLHMSKGLEFDVVFALGVVNRTPQHSELVPIRQKEKIYLTSVRADDPLYEAHLEECDAEKSRQLYVALTRAKKKVYVPFIAGNLQNKPSFGEASPLELHAARIGQGKLTWHEVYTRLPDVDHTAFDKLQNEALTKVFLERDALRCETGDQVSFNLHPPKELRLNFPNLVATSYSRLIFSHNERKKDAPHDFAAADKTVQTLPAGASTGEFLHKLLEDVPFELCSSYDELQGWVLSQIKYTPFQSWEAALTDLIYRAFTLPLGTSGIILSKVQRVFREREFVIPLDLASHLPECKGLEGELKGVIDLAFEYEGKYYLLDWKSNWLEDYTHEALYHVMEANRYDLQAKLYEIAFNQYLKALGIKDSVAGVFYIFLRGFNGNEGAYVYTSN